MQTNDFTLLRGLITLNYKFTTFWIILCSWTGANTGFELMETLCSQVKIQSIRDLETYVKWSIDKDVKY
jgi:hypothetical protein